MLLDNLSISIHLTTKITHKTKTMFPFFYFPPTRTPFSIWFSSQTKLLSHFLSQHYILTLQSEPIFYITATSSTIINFKLLNITFLLNNLYTMSSRSRAWTWSVATSVGVVEALKDQGICRWNSVIRSAQQHAKHNMRSLSHANNKISSTKLRDEKSKQSEESLRTVMFLSCWGPN